MTLGSVPSRSPPRGAGRSKPPSPPGKKRSPRPPPPEHRSMPLPTITSALIDELHQEAATTRRVLERVPEEHLSWRPHPKSMSLGQLALHIARIPGAIAELLAELERDPPVVPIPEAGSRAESVEH